MSIEQQAAAMIRPRLAFRPVAEIMDNVTAPDWLIRSYIEADTLLMLFGDPGSGKSFLAMDWAACVATGRDWHGRRVKQGPVLYVNGEGQNGAGRRFAAWQIANATSLHDAPLFVSTMATELTNVIARAEIEAVIADFIAEFGKPVLIVFDTLARNFGPGDENNTRDMTQAIATCDGVRTMTGATVALVHHVGHGDKSRGRGSMALKAALDAEYRAQRASSGEVIVEATKMKDAPDPEPLAFRFDSVPLGIVDDEGEPVTSAVLVPASMPAPCKPEGLGKNQAEALGLLRDEYARCRRNLESTGRDPSKALIETDRFRSMLRDKGHHRNTIYKTIETLKGRDLIRIDGLHVLLSDAGGDE